jgi:hypothetical protein
VELAIQTVAASEGGQTLVRTRRVRRIVAMVAAACLVAAVAVAAFLAGEHHQRPYTVLTGVATVGDHQATVIVAGWAYGIEGSIPWVDQQGVTHEGGWPACLGTPGSTVPVTFAEIPVTTPGGPTSRQVVWIECRP